MVYLRKKTQSSISATLKSSMQRRLDLGKVHREQPELDILKFTLIIFCFIALNRNKRSKNAEDKL